MWRALVVIALALHLGSVQAAEFQVPRPAAQWKRPFLKAQHAVWGLNTPALLASQVGQESSWKDGLTSSAGAKGMTQFMPATAAALEKQVPGLASLGRYSPPWAFRAQALLMKQLFDTYDDVRDSCNTGKFALSAFNGGGMINREIGLCHKDQAKGCDHRQWDHVAPKNARRASAWIENRTYVSRITQRTAIYAADGWGVDLCASVKQPLQDLPSEAPLTERTPAP